MLADGRCFNNRNQLIGFVNANDATAGTSSEDYLGKAVVQVMPYVGLSHNFHSGNEPSLLRGLQSP
jgi:hypothetical protein